MKYIDEVDIELVNQELNFHTNDDSLVIKGGCDLFTTKPISSDRKLYKAIDKHLTQMVHDNEMSRIIEKERKDSINSMFPSSPTQSPEIHATDSRRGSFNTRMGPGIRRDSNTTVNTTDTSMDSIDVDESPFGSLKTSSTKWTFANLIAILNTTFPDHDFSNLQPTTENFNKLNNPEDLIHRFNNLMVSLGKNEETINWIWDRIDSYMNLVPKDNSSYERRPSQSHNTQGGPQSNSNHPTEYCQVFEFVPSDHTIIEDINYPYQTMWSYYWFIYNKKKKKVAFIYLTAINKVHYSMLNGNRKVSFRSSKKVDRSELINPDDMFDDSSMDDFDEEAVVDDSDIEDIEI